MNDLVLEAAGSEKTIEVTDLRRSFGEIQAVDGVSFEVRRGETLGLLGPNGAGKSTTMHLLVGVLAADSGEVKIVGESDPTRDKVRRQLGLAPQSIALYDELTAQENLRFFGRLYGMSGSTLAERVNWALELSGLTARRSDRVKTYSGGMQRRLNLACALVHDPPVLLLDEPTVGVDPQSRNHIFECIEDLRRRGRTIVYTTHYMEEAQRLCDRVAIMDHGKILAFDSVDRLIAGHGGSPVLRAEVREPPANPESLPGTWDGTSVRICCDRPLDVAAELSAQGVKIEKLSLDQPDLESVFLALTGRSLRDS